MAIDLEPGRLEAVGARTVWPLELAFSTWLGSHLDRLGEAISSDLELESLEMPVGPFYADLVCRVVGSGEVVVIENQFGRSDHDHLGKLLTYAAHRKAAVAVWIAESFAEEHRAAIDWLNQDIAAEARRAVLAVKLQLLQIGDSVPALRFDLIAAPIGWGQPLPTSGMSETTERHQRFFAGLLATVKAKVPGLTRANKASPQSWTSFPTGRTGFQYTVEWLRGAKLRIGVYISTGDAARNKAYFDGLQQSQEEIEAEMDATMAWERRDQRKDSMIMLYRDDFDEADEPTWPEIYGWAADMLTNMRRVFGPRILALPDIGLPPEPVTLPASSEESLGLS